MSFTRPTFRRIQIQDLPNISIALGEDLRRSGIKTSHDIAALGVENAWERLRETGRYDDLHTILVLEGAMTGQPWRALPGERRAELLRYASHALDRTMAHAA